MLDNDARPASQGFDPGRGYWGFGPDYLVVQKGESVRFVNPATNNFPHTATSIEMGSDGPFGGTLAVGAKFDSSPTREALVQKGNEWTLDTSNMDPGHYSYYCRIHPWMVAKLTVTE
jgi:plastocyanin